MGENNMFDYDYWKAQFIIESDKWTCSRMSGRLMSWKDQYKNSNRISKIRKILNKL